MDKKSETITDEELVVLSRTTDPEAYGYIIRRYQPKLTHYLRKFLRSQDELEDVLQDVFIKIYQNLNGFNVHNKFSPWAYRIAHNEAINHLKKYSKEFFSLDDRELEIIDRSLDVKEQTDLILMKTKVENALKKLSEKYRAPLILYFFEQKSYEEISEILRVPRNTAGTLIARGKNKLKEYLA